MKDICSWINFMEAKFKVGLSPSKKRFLFALMIAFKNDEKCFSFHLKSSFRAQDI